MKYVFFTPLATKYDEKLLPIFEVNFLIASSAEKVRINLPINMFLKYPKPNKILFLFHLSWFRAPKSFLISVNTTITQHKNFRININNFIT